MNLCVCVAMRQVALYIFIVQPIKSSVSFKKGMWQVLYIFIVQPSSQDSGGGIKKEACD